MDFDVAGVQSLAGGSTGGTPYSGKDGRKRWDKMKENVIKEWEEEQRKKNGQSASTSVPTSQETQADSKSKLEEEQEDKMKQEKEASKGSRMEKLKAKIFNY